LQSNIKTAQKDTKKVKDQQVQQPENKRYEEYYKITQTSI
jgi:hypothetical protein